MIYNQKQRQLIIWDQRTSIATFKSLSLLFNLGMRLSVRSFGRKLKQMLAYEPATLDVLYHKEPLINS